MSNRGSAAGGPGRPRSATMKMRLLNQQFTLREIWKLRRSFAPVLLSPRKMINLGKLRRDLMLRRTSLSGNPSIVMVEPCSYCDISCPMCPVVLNRTRRPRADLPFPVFQRLIDQIGDELMLITFWNFGEPLLNQDIFRMVRLAKTKKIICALSSNLLSLTPPRAEEMIDSGLDYLIVSCDGASEETYEKFRGKGNFRRVVENLAYLTRRRAEKKVVRPFVNLQFIVMRENEHEIGAIRELSRTMGADKLSLKKFTYVSEETRSFLPANPAYVLGKYAQGTAMTFCARPWTSAVLCADGSVVPCCGDLDFARRFGSLADGNSAFPAIWNGEKYRRFRSAVLKDINEIEMCRTCPSTNFTTDMFIE